MLSFRNNVLTLFSFLIILCSLTIDNCLCQWEQVSNGMGNVNIYSLAYIGNNIFAGTLGHGVYLSTNNGINWAHSGLDSQNVRSFTVNGNYIFAGTQSYGVFLSTNNGTNWSQTQIDNQVVLSLGVNGKYIFAGTVAEGIYLSTDNGLNWSQSSFNDQNVYSIASSGNNVFAGTSANGIYLSSDNGINWTQSSLTNKNVLSLAVNGNNIFAGTYIHGVYLSTNNGTGWTQTSLNDQNVYSLAVNGDNVFAGAHSPPNSFYVSADNGVNWTPRSEGLSNALNIPALCVMNNYIFAGTDGYGVYRRPLSELTGIKPISNEIPGIFFLSQNYPNPFNPSTNLEFGISNLGFVSLKVYDISGKEVMTLVNQKLSRGNYEVEFNAGNLSSGVYFYKIQSGEFTEVKKMYLIK